MTIRDVVSTVKNNLNLLNLDSKISNQFVYSLAANVASFLIKREAEYKRLFKNTSIFKKLDCVELEERSLLECGVNLGCRTIMRSKKPLPKTFLSNFGSVIQIFNLLRDKDYKEISATGYKTMMQQKYKSRNTKYFWIENDYLYVPDSEVEILIVLGLFSNPEEVIAFNGGCDKLLDFPFPAPDYLLQPIIEQTLKQLSIKLQIPEDENSNLNSNLK